MLSLSQGCSLLMKSLPEQLSFKAFWVSYFLKCVLAYACRSLGW